MRGRPIVVEDGETRQFCPLPWQSAKSLVNGAGFARFPYHGAASGSRAAFRRMPFVWASCPGGYRHEGGWEGRPWTLRETREQTLHFGSSSGDWNNATGTPILPGVVSAFGQSRVGARKQKQDRVARSRPAMAVTGTGGEPMSCRSGEKPNSRRPAVVAGTWSGEQSIRSLPVVGLPIRGVAGREFDLPPRKVVKRSTRP